jgi:8-oxo-dGTP diphosphatase
MMALSGGSLRDAEEPILVAGHRELSEEAGLDADALRLEQFGVYVDPGREPRGQVVSMGVRLEQELLPQDPGHPRLLRPAGHPPMTQPASPPPQAPVSEEKE